MPKKMTTREKAKTMVNDRKKRRDDKLKRDGNIFDTNDTEANKRVGPRGCRHKTRSLRETRSSRAHDILTRREKGGVVPALFPGLLKMNMMGAVGNVVWKLDSQHSFPSAKDVPCPPQNEHGQRLDR